MYVFFDGRLIVIETNVEWALAYWRKRKQADERITWKFRQTRA